MVPDLVGRSEINGFELSLCEAQETTGFMEDCLEDTGEKTERLAVKMM
jgi:hypothetical protein